MVKLKEKNLFLYLKFLYVSTLPTLIIVGKNTGGILGTLHDLKVTNIPNCHRTHPKKTPCSFSDEIVPSITLGGGVGISHFGYFMFTLRTFGTLRECCHMFPCL